MPPAGWVLYDDSCGSCLQSVPYWRETLGKRGFSIAPLHSAWVQERLNALGHELLDDLRLLLPDGRQVHGADVYRYVMRRVWWAYPLYLLSVAPLLSRLFDWSYRSLAVNRYRFSRACGLPGREA